MTLSWVFSSSLVLNHFKYLDKVFLVKILGVRGPQNAKPQQSQQNLCHIYSPVN